MDTSQDGRYMITLSLSSLLCGAAYRLRGGGFFSFSSTLIARAIWGAVIALTYFFTANSHSQMRDIYAPLLLFLSYAALMVPHAYCQNMGRWAVAQKKWPSFFMPSLTQSAWLNLPFWQRFVYDFISMTGVGFFRSLIAFLPFLIVYNLVYGSWPVIQVIQAIAVLSVGQPLAYSFGYLMPITLGGSLARRSVEWGEFFNGMVWAFAVACL